MGFEKYNLNEKKKEFCQILKYFYPKPSKSRIFFLYLALPGMATVKEDDFKQISYCWRKFAKQFNLKGLKNG